MTLQSFQSVERVGVDGGWPLSTKVQEERSFLEQLLAHCVLYPHFCVRCIPFQDFVGCSIHSFVRQQVVEWLGTHRVGIQGLYVVSL